MKSVELPQAHFSSEEQIPLTYQTSSLRPDNHHMYQPIDLHDIGDKREESSWKWATKRPVVLYLIPFFFLLLLVFVRLGHDDFDILGKADTDTDPMHITIDASRTLYQVVDNNPQFGNWNNNPTPHVLATAKYVKNYNNNGWHYLHIETIDLQALARNITGKRHHTVYGSIENGNNVVNGTNISLDFMIEEYLRTMKAMGYVEGFATCHEMSAWYVNFYSGLFDGGDPTDEALEFLETNHDWMRQQSETLYKQSDYWMSVKGLIAQLDGMVAGMKVGCPGTEQVRNESPWTTQESANGIFLPSLHRRPSLIHLLLMNANGDLYQIAEKFQQAKAPPSTDFFDDDDFTFDTFDGAKEDHHNHNPSVDSSTSSESSSGTTAATGGGGAKSSQKKKRVLKNKLRSQRRRASQQTEEQGEGHHFPNRVKVWNRQTYLTTKKTVHSAEKQATTDILSESSRRTPSGRTLDHVKHLLDTKSSPTSPVPDVEGDSTPNGRDAFLSNFGIKLTNRQRTRRNDHCSVLIKLADDLSDVIFGHNTWDDFQCAGPRIFKHYSYNVLKDLQPKGMYTVDFSSSPGLISSVDDFYIVHGPEGHLAVLETS